MRGNQFVLFVLALSLISFSGRASEAASNAYVCKKYSGNLSATTHRSAYATPVVQPPGQPWAYIAWVWRENGDVSTNHTVSIARTQDLKNWSDTCGDAISLPISLSNGEVIDNLQVGDGLLNAIQLSYDNEGRIVVTYQKYVKVNGVQTTQVFNARRDTTGWSIFQMTHYTTNWELTGVGTLPVTPDTIYYSGINFSPDGSTMYQDFVRAAADKTGSPWPGTSVVGVNAAGGMVIQGNYVAAALPKTDFEWNPPSPAAIAVPDPNPVSPWATTRHIATLASRYQSRWIPLRGNWTGSGNQPGLYDSYMSRFYYWVNGIGSSFGFGWVAPQVVFQPMVGDWIHNGKDTIGIYDTAENESYLKDSLSGGNANATITGKPSSAQGLADAPWIWHTWDPAKQYLIRWENMPANADNPYDCAGNPLPNGTEAGLVVAKCPQNFVGNLTLWTFNPSTGAWSSSIIDKAWEGSSASFDFLTFKNVQIVGYYNAKRQLTVATRVVGSNESGSWTIQPSDSVYAGWDSHNYVTVAVDANDDIHVSGNMHATALNYFRAHALLASNLKAYAMTGTDETQVTYPEFFYTPQGEFAFTYRDGMSGDGNTWIDVYDVGSMTWKHLNTEPLFAGEPN